MPKTEPALSLKAFHIFFIAVSVLTAFGFGVWSVLAYAEEGGFGYLAMGGLSFIVGIALIIYGINFLHKLKHVRYL